MAGGTATVKQRKIRPGTLLATPQTKDFRRTSAGVTMPTTETRAIDWQRDVDAALAEATRTNRPVLLDFTAAPR